MLHHQAFDNSFQANILIDVKSGNIILANAAACKLFGYSKKQLLTQSRSTIFNVKESSFIQMLKERVAEGHSTAFVSAIKKGGKSFPCEITSAVFKDEEGVEKSINTIADISQSILKQKNIDIKKAQIVADNIVLAKSKQKEIDIKKEKAVAHDIVVAKSKQKIIDLKLQKIVANDIIVALAKSDARLAENNEWIQYIAKTSYDVMWDWDIATDEIYVGDSIEEVFGYKIKNNGVNISDFSNCLIPEEKRTVEKKLLRALASGNKSWKDFFMFRRQDGSIASTTSRASIVRDEKGKAIRMIGAIQDVSNLQELEKKLNEHITIQEGQQFLQVAKIPLDVIWDWNLLTNEFFLGEGFEELFGYAIKNNKGTVNTDWTNCLHTDDREAVEIGLKNAIASSATSWEHTYRFIRADGSIANVFNRASIIRYEYGKAYRMIGSMQDLTKQHALEERLEQEIKLKEKQVAEAMEEAKENERLDIGKELHDNVNQLLGASKLCLDMAKQGGEGSAMYLNRSSQYTITAIEEIRKLTKGLTTDTIKNLGLCEAIENLVRETMEVDPLKVSCALKRFVEERVNDKFKLYAFRIVQEQLNNILKHAKATEVAIGLSQNKKLIVLTISDNGVGFDTTAQHKGIGIANIKSRAASYNGTADFVSEPGKGCALTVTFSATEPLLMACPNK